MPIYEFYCPDNHKIYQFFARSQDEAKKIPKCPDNPAFRMERTVSRFAIGKGGAGPDEAPGTAQPGDGDPAGPQIDERAMGQVMREMEGAMAGMDESNPDPRVLGKLMRRMAEVSGERLDGGLEEMVRKLEEGADPEKLEEELGDVLGDDAGPAGGGGGFMGAPSRDGNLYDYD